MKNNLQWNGYWEVDCYDKDGNLKWSDRIDNSIMDAAITNMLSVYFDSGSASANFYVALIRDDNFTGINTADTAASHSGWEEGDEYDEATRPAWTIVPPASQSATNAASPAEFNISGTEIMKGLALYNENTISGSSGILIAAGLFAGGDKSVVANDLLRATYIISGTG